MLCATEHTVTGARHHLTGYYFEDRLFVTCGNRCVTCPKHFVETHPAFPGIVSNR